jgi:hypothetical protein
MQQTWDVNNWVLQLFFQFLDRSTADKLRMPDFEATSPDLQRDMDGEGPSLRNVRTPGTDAQQAGQNGTTSASTRIGHEDDINVNMTQMTSYNAGGDENLSNMILPQEFNMNFEEGDDFNQYFGSPMGGDLSAQGLDFLSRCL